MREKELRIALVCFGGVSLAVYMHGISKEILKLVRGSAALHAIADRNKRSHANFFDNVDVNDPEHDTEAIYFELLRDIGRKIELRVIVDIIAGASAGGINGTMLARALSHDLPMESLRNLWIENADVTVLLAPEARARAWSKFFLLPFIWAAMRYGMLPADNPEVRSKLSLFLRSRWFKPPLSGATMDELMYNAVTAMGTPRSTGASLIPSGQALDLFVTLTDYHGYSELIPIHDPPMIYEVDHHQTLRFSYRRWANGEVRSDFVIGNAPALAFAARATSSFPGAFPPARILDIDALVERRRARWPMREEFIAGNFNRHRMAHIDPVTASFIDGSVLNNRPFREAIEAIQGRAAYRQVDRRLVYIDPDPTPLATMSRQTVPGFFSTLRGAMSDIPRTQPVTEELSWVSDFNEQVSRIRSIVESARPQVHELVTKTIAEPLDRPLAPEELRKWREQVNAHVARDAGFAYEGYVRLKLASVCDFLVSILVKLRDVPERSPLAQAIAIVIERWATQRGLMYSKQGAAVPVENGGKPGALARWAEFLLAFDVKYRERRLNFLIEGQNRLYEMLHQTAYFDLDPGVVDRLKRSFYVMLDDIRNRQAVPNFAPETYELTQKIFSEMPSSENMRALDQYADRLIEERGADIDRLVDRLAVEINLDGTTHELDVLLAMLDVKEWHLDARRDVLVNYLGFPFWDVLTFPLMSAREIGEFNQILVDRISPQDATALKSFAGSASLKGVRFGHFAAFLSREYRENDYLLGRLHALDRLIDIICDSAGVEKDDGIDIAALKKRGFLRIIATEDRHLKLSRKLIRDLQKAISEM
jgi:patatin-related protein